MYFENSFILNLWLLAGKGRRIKWKVGIDTYIPTEHKELYSMLYNDMWEKNLTKSGFMSMYNRFTLLYT